MTADVTSQTVKTALASVNDPALGMDIVALGFVKDVAVSGDDIKVALQLTTPACPSKDTIVQAARDAITKAMPQARVTVETTAEVWTRHSVTSSPHLASVKNIIAVSSGKGGVGKSTVTTNLAAALHLSGARVGIMDADIYGPSIPQMMGDPDVMSAATKDSKIAPAVHHGMQVISIGFFIERDKPVIWRGPMVHKLLQQFIEDVQWGALDYLLIDLPPGTGDAQLSLSQLLPVTGAVVVTTPQEVSMLDVEKALAMWKKVEVPVIGVVENMSHFKCPSCGHAEAIFSRGGGRELAARESLKFLGEVPIQSRVREGGDRGKPITLAEPDGDMATIFKRIAGQVACHLSTFNKPDPNAGIRSNRLTMIR